MSRIGFRVRIKARELIQHEQLTTDHGQRTAFLPTGH
jgi:hypothetical protein